MPANKWLEIFLIFSQPHPGHNIESKNHPLNQVPRKINLSHAKKLTELQAASPPRSDHSSSQVRSHYQILYPQTPRSLHQN